MEYLPRIFNTLQLSQEVQELLLRLNETPENFTGRILFMSMFNDILWGSKDNKKECESNCQHRLSLCKEIWSRTMVIPRAWIREKCYSISEDSPQGEWDKSLS